MSLQATHTRPLRRSKVFEGHRISPAIARLAFVLRLLDDRAPCVVQLPLSVLFSRSIDHYER